VTTWSDESGRKRERNVENGLTHVVLSHPKKTKKPKNQKNQKTTKAGEKLRKTENSRISWQMDCGNVKFI